MIGMILFFVVAMGFVVLVGKFVVSIADKQEAARDQIISKEMESAFHHSVKIYSHRDEHDFLNVFLETQNQIFVTNRKKIRPKRFVIEGVDEKGRSFIAAAIQNVRHQSGGYLRYTYLYAVRGARAECRGSSIQTAQIKDYEVVFAQNVYKGDYVYDAGRYEKLTACIL